MIKSFVCSGKWIYVNAPSGCSIMSTNSNVLFNIPSGFYALNRDELQDYFSNNYLTFVYDDAASIDVYSTDFAINGILSSASGGGGDAAILQHISDLLDAYIIPKVTTDLGTLSASFDGSNIIVIIPDDSVYFKGKVDSDIVFDFSDASFVFDGSMSYDCSNTSMFKLIRFLQGFKYYNFIVSGDLSLSYPVVFKDSHGIVYSVSLSDLGSVSYVFSGGVNAISGTSYCEVQDSSVSGSGKGFCKPSEILAAKLDNSSLIITCNPSISLNSENNSFFGFYDGQNGCTFTSGVTDLKCTFHISFDFASKN